VRDVTVVLLAAGESTRMGRQKALIPWGGAATLLEYHLAQFDATADVGEVIVVTGHEPERISQIVAGAARARCVHNAAYKAGKVSSITTGVAAILEDAGALMLLAVDQPRPAAILRALLDAHFDSSAAITVPVYEGHRGHPVIFGRALFGALLAISEETLGVRAVMLRHAAAVIEVEVEDAVVRLDLNAPGDVEAGVWEPSP
jgi:molybdenum cofactor cytidylyltransferase